MALAARASVDFRVVVPAIFRVKTLGQHDRVEITRQHIAQGYADVEDASLLLVTSNSATGYTIAIAFESGVLSRIEVRVQDERGEARGGTGSIHVHARRLVDAPLRIGYRLYLNPEVRAGTYRWPVALAFAPDGA
jgi:hypothetical protein